MAERSEPIPRQSVLIAAEDHVGLAKAISKATMGYLGRLPQTPDTAHLLKEMQRIHGHLNRSQQLFRELRARDDQ